MELPTTIKYDNMFSLTIQVVGCTRNMIRTVRKMKAEGKSLAPNFKGGARRIGRESVLDKVPSIYDFYKTFAPPNLFANFSYCLCPVISILLKLPLKLGCFSDPLTLPNLDVIYGNPQKASSLLAEDPSMSMRAIAKKLGVSRGSLGRILKADEKTATVRNISVCSS